MALITALHAERLAIRAYTPLDGLPGVAIHRIVRDSDGFLWFCTGEGLSRFDGYEFKNYRAADGLPEPNVTDFVESREGVYWVATSGGVCRFDPVNRSSTRPGLRFQVFVPPGDRGAAWINTLLEDPSGVLWVGTEAGLFRLQRSGQQWKFTSVKLPIPDSAPWSRRVAALRWTPEGVWIGVDSGLFLLRTDGQVEHYARKNGLPSDQVHSLMRDSRGVMWAGTSAGLVQLLRIPEGAGRIVQRLYTTANGLPGKTVKAILESSNGTIWVGTRGGVAVLKYKSDPKSPTFWADIDGEGLAGADIHTLTEDSDGNIWMGTDSGGALKAATNGFVSYNLGDGLGSTHVIGMLEDSEGVLCVITKAPGRLFLNSFDGRRFKATRLNVPASFYHSNWLGWYQVMVQSRDREWWAASAAGLLRFPAAKDAASLANKAPSRRYSSLDGMAGDHVHQLFEDSHGYLWISTRDPTGNGITRWDPVSESFYRLSEKDGIPSLKTNRANGFFEDLAGQIWIGLHRIGVVRYARGRAKIFRESDGLPAGGIRRIHQDRNGRLWLGSGQGGVARLDQPEAAKPAFVRYGVSEGLSGNEIQAITEDQWGRIYVGTGHGVDRLDPASGYVRHYTAADGLAPGEVQTALRDRNGVLWFGTVHGVSKLVPVRDFQRAAPRIRVTSVRVGSEAYPVGENGAVAIAVPNLAANQNHIQVDYRGLSFASGEVLRYQYRLEGADRDWSGQTKQRSVIYGGLAAGKYRFLVRAINADGETSEPAFVAFTILPALWQRWWVRMLAFALLGTGVYVAYRYRTAKLLELERVRTRIATDLHDDIGASLSQIAILSEVAKRRAGDADGLRDTLSEVASVSRELVDSMSDIVWAVDPEKDRLRDLAQRMRAFASDVCTARNIQLQFGSPDSLDQFVAHSDVRRHAFLVFKESVHNAARHSGCTRLRADLGIAGGRLIVEVTDNGKGFDFSQSPRGHGLKNMKERAREAGGELRIFSDPGEGSKVTLEIPLHPRTRKKYLHGWVGDGNTPSV